MTKVALIHQEATDDSRTGTAFYFTAQQPLRSDPFRVVELWTPFSPSQEGRYFVQTFRQEWTPVISDVKAASPEAALQVALAVLLWDR